MTNILLTWPEINIQPDLRNLLCLLQHTGRDILYIPPTTIIQDQVAVTKLANEYTIKIVTKNNDDMTDYVEITSFGAFMAYIKSLPQQETTTYQLKRNTPTYKEGLKTLFRQNY